MQSKTFTPTSGTAVQSPTIPSSGGGYDESMNWQKVSEPELLAYLKTHPNDQDCINEVNRRGLTPPPGFNIGT